ncbi:MAG TPA: pyridine nucleotide-disulfide oxidoreductase, partial [Brevibacterium sp.]|nr:pyridine nucleotide-disulfide oxidoreductase [Brevibacterium sp.]
MTDVVVIGGGQAGLAAGYFLRRTGLEFVILDDHAGPGGAWQHGWQSLRLFSPAGYSPLPGWPMPAQKGESFPTADHVIDYLTRYERRYDLPVHRPVHVSNVYQDRGQLFVDTDTGTLETTAVISATGTWQRPYVPAYPGCEDFTGRQLLNRPGDN